MNGKPIYGGSTVGPDMSDVPFGKPEPDYRPSTIGQGLLDLAAWFDIYDDRAGYNGERTVQRDLRAWASRTADMPADRTTVSSEKCPGCSTDGSNFMGLQGHLPDCIYNPMKAGTPEGE